MGSCLELDKRIERHKKHTGGKTTHNGDWQLVCYKFFSDVSDARKVEKIVKSYKGGNAFKKIVSGDMDNTERWPRG